jgi:16S rRNA (cytosine1402-N4)-methyltransferase
MNQTFHPSSNAYFSHKPVMLDEVIEKLSPQSGKTYVDGTFGGGGYTKGILDAADCNVIAIDRDPDAIARGAELKEQYGTRLTLLEGTFGAIQDLLQQNNTPSIDGIVLDLGVSSYQIDDPERGFSFKKDGPLDMRMGTSEFTAADVVNSYPEEKIANIIYNYGDERLSRKIAKAIIAKRREEKFSTTKELAELVRSVVPKSKDGIDPATRTFQAIRIHINDELQELESCLGAIDDYLKQNGRVVVVSFHSLEDRIVKSFFRLKAGQVSNPSRHLPDLGHTTPPSNYKIITRKAVLPTKQEVSSNIRSRSARLRTLERISPITKESSDV